jgi:hypothetical protein
VGTLFQGKIFLPFRRMSKRPKFIVAMGWQRGAFLLPMNEPGGLQKVSRSETVLF